MNANSVPPTRTRQALRLAGYNALTLATLIILVELGLHVFDFEFTLPPPRVEFGDPSPTTLKHLRTDPDLLWVPRDYPDRVAAARGSRPSIVFMGDSCTNGGYETQLQSIIAERYPDGDFTWVTLGVTGWSSWSGLQQLQRDVLPIRPRAITIYFGWNDHWNYFGLQDKDAARFLYPDRSSRPSALFSRLRTVQLVNKALLAHEEHFAEPGQARVSPDDFRDNLRQMVRIARHNDIIPILLTAPTSHQPGQEPAYLATRWLTHLEDLVPLHRRYVQVVREVAAAENAPLIDLYREFAQLPRRDLESLFKRDGIHLRAAGNRKIAELIDRRLNETGLYRQIIGVGADSFP